MPMPPPMQRVARPFFTLRFFISWSSVTRMRAPEAPTGWPSAIAPPFTLTISLLKPSSLATDGDDTLYYFSIEYAGGLTLRTEQQAGIPDKLRADIIHDDFRDGLRRAVRTYASLPRQSGAGLDANTALVGSYWTIDFVERQ